MKINGKDIGLRYTTGTAIWWQEFIKTDPDVAADRVAVLLAVKMSEAYARVNGGDKVTEEELIDMEYDDFLKLRDEIMTIMKLDSQTSIETKEPKGKGKNAKSAAEKQN